MQQPVSVPIKLFISDCFDKAGFDIVPELDRHQIELEFIAAAERGTFRANHWRRLIIIAKEYNLPGIA